MKAIQLTTYGGPEVLEVIDAPVPEPRPGELRVKLAAIGVNYIDTYQRSGLYQIPLPTILGMEGSGTVDALGEGVTEFSIGDRVAYSAGPKSYAEYAVVPADRSVSLPDALSFELGAATMLQGMTAHYLARSVYALGPEHSCLVHAAAGGVGLLLVQLAKAAGAFVIATVSTAEKAARARAMGADEIILYRDSDFVAETLRITNGKGVNVVYDSVGKDTFLGSVRCLRPRGMLVLYGQSSGPIGSFDPLLLSQQGSLFMTRPRLDNYIATQEELQWRASELFAGIERNALHVHIGATYPLASAAEAHRALESRATMGKVLLVP